MQVDAFFARDEAGSFQEIGFQLFKITGFAGVVACCLDAIASLTILLVEARHVVSCQQWMEMAFSASRASARSTSTPKRL